MTDLPPDASERFFSFSRATLPLSVWALYGFFFIKAFLTGANYSERILLTLLVMAISVSLWETIVTPMLVERVRLKDPILSLAGALLVYLGADWARTTPVVACAVVGTLAGFWGLSGAGSRQTHAGPIYCGAFVGMTSALILPNPWWIAAAGLLAGYFYSVSGQVVRGIGGKMGSTAFAGAMVTILLARVATMAGPGPKIIALDSAGKLAVLIASLCAPSISYGLAQNWGLGPILGSALPSAVAALALHSQGHSIPFAVGPVAAAWFGGSFIGMTLPHRIGTRPWMLPIMGLLFGWLWISFKPPLVGIGGGLGATAAVSVLAVVGAVRFAEITFASLRSFGNKSWSAKQAGMERGK